MLYNYGVNKKPEEKYKMEKNKIKKKKKYRVNKIGKNKCIYAFSTIFNVLPK